MAAAKMLTQLLRGDNIAYIVRPVANFDDVKNTISNNLTTDIKTVFMVNCGAVRGPILYFYFITLHHIFRYIDRSTIFPSISIWSRVVTCDATSSTITAQFI